jgi:glutathionylspermidine synthase
LRKSAQDAKLPWIAGNPLTAEQWKAYRGRLASESLEHDIPPADYYPPASFPLLLDRNEWLSLARTAEKLTAEVLAAERELIGRIDLHARLGLPASIRQVFAKWGPDSVPPGVARYMRFDFHLTQEGWRISEVNADIANGFNVGSLFTELMAPYYLQCSRPPDPARALAKAVLRAVGAGALVAVVRRTARARDCESKYLASEVRKQGMQAVIVSPGDLLWRSNGVPIIRGAGNRAPDLLIPLLEVDWLPRLRPGSQWKRWFGRGWSMISNPGTSVLIESKRLPLVWDELETPMPTWRTAIIPETCCPSQLKSVRGGEWVLKRAFGGVGQGVAIAGITSRRAYKEAARQAKRHPHGWVAQRRFEMVPIETPRGLRHICLGIFTVDGKAAGAFARSSKTALIGLETEDAVVLLRKS